jgi:hypothetical protein
VKDTNGDGTPDDPYVAIVNGDGSSGVLVTDYEQTITQDITQDIWLGEEGLFYPDADGVLQNGNVKFEQTFVQEGIPVFYDDYSDWSEASEFFNIIDPTNPNVDLNESVDLGSNIRVVNVLADGYIEIEQDFVQTINQDVIIDIFYEVDLIQDIVQDVDINQTYTVDEIVTETRTRLAGD